eukprot:CAMPEP_0172045214 /NCGR_PEP_ID=MMETSP1041-20130122/27221_1 /TAXON_ID=464988 /ORGANISM="Hemiselmis andersenii, Strain CCMP439" /LENGTH=203 /DNA_ID=CAMNT_0012703781 /DNA_START=46 /DNA_END=657 /DNA_ORIENTATION=+
MASAVHEQHIGGEGFRQRHLMRVVGRRWAMSRILVLLAFLFPVAAGVERCCRCSSSAWLQITLSPACATLILNYTNHSTTPNTIDNASFQLLPTSSPPSVSSVVFREQSYSSSSYPSTAKAVLTGGSTIYLRSSSAGECDSNHAQCPSACTDVGGCCPDPKMPRVCAVQGVRGGAVQERRVQGGQRHGRRDGVHQLCGVRGGG